MRKFLVTEINEIKVTAIVEAENAAKAKLLYKNNKGIGSTEFSEESHIVVREDKKLSFGG